MMRKFIILTFIVLLHCNFLLCCRAYGDDTQEAISTPILTSVPNFRDIAGIAAIYGGTGFANPTSNDGVMRTGVFYRSNVLTLVAQTIPKQVYLPISPADQRG